MKKILMILMMILGVTSQAQEFDFSCNSGPGVTVTYKVKYGSSYNDIISLSHTFIEGEDDYKDGLIFNLPDGYSVSENIAAGAFYVTKNKLVANHNAISSNATSVIVNSYTVGFDYDQADFDIVMDVSSKINSPGVTVTYKLKYGSSSDDVVPFYHTFIEGEDDYKDGIVFNLPDDYSVSENIAASEFYTSKNKLVANHGAISSDATSITVNSYTVGFDYDQGDFDIVIDMSSKIALPETEEVKVSLQLDLVDYLSDYPIIPFGTDNGVVDATLIEGTAVVTKTFGFYDDLLDGTAVVKNAFSKKTFSTYKGITISILAGEVNDETLTIEWKVDPDSFDYAQNDFALPPYSFYGKVGIVAPNNPTDVTVKGYNDLTDVNTISSDDGKSKYTYTIPLPAGYFYQSASTGYVNSVEYSTITYKILSQPKGSQSTTIEITPKSNFNYTGNAWTIDLGDLNSDNIGVGPGQLSYPGNMFDLISNSEGTPSAVPETTTTKVRVKLKVTSANANYYSHVPSNDNLVFAYGGSRIHRWTGSTLNQEAASSSNWNQWKKELVVGGTFNDYTRISEADSTYDIFIRWYDGKSKYDLIIITHNDFNYNTSQKTAGGSFFEMRSFEYGTMRNFDVALDMNGTPKDLTGLERTFDYWIQVDDNNFTVEKTYDMPGENQIGTIGDSNIMDFGSLNVSWPDSNKSTTHSFDEAAFDDRRIYGGKYHGYVMIANPWPDNGGNVKLFAKWSSGTQTMKMIGVFEKGINWSDGDYEIKNWKLIPGKLWNYGCNNNEGCYGTY